MALSVSEFRSDAWCGVAGESATRRGGLGAGLAAGDCPGGGGRVGGASAELADESVSIGVLASTIDGGGGVETASGRMRGFSRREGSGAFSSLMNLGGKEGSLAPDCRVGEREKLNGTKDVGLN